MCLRMGVTTLGRMAAMKRKKKEIQAVKADSSRLERDLSGLIETDDRSALRTLMRQMAALEQESTRFYVTSRPACNSD